MKNIFIQGTGIFIILAIIVACGAKGTRKDDKQVVIPSSLEIYNIANTSNDKGLSLAEKQSKYKIYTLIDASCSTCLDKFTRWNEFYSLISNAENCELNAICYSKDNFELIKYLFENNEIKPINYSIMFDINNDFQKLNAKLIENSMAFAVLTDSQNNVLELGYPISNHNDRELFISRINTID